MTGSAPSVSVPIVPLVGISVIWSGNCCVTTAGPLASVSPVVGTSVAYSLSPGSVTVASPGGVPSSAVNGISFPVSVTAFFIKVGSGIGTHPSGGVSVTSSRGPPSGDGSSVLGRSVSSVVPVPSPVGSRAVVMA